MNRSSSPVRRFAGAAIVCTALATVMCLVASGPLRAQDAAGAKSDQTYSIQRLYKAGEVDHYKMTSSQKVNGPLTGGQEYNVKMSVVLKETTKSVTEAGKVTVLEEYTKADVDVNGTSQDMLSSMPKITVITDKLGHVDVNAEGGQDAIVKVFSDMAKSMTQSQSAILPKKPVKIGDSWSAEIPGLAGDPDVKTSITIKLDGVETLNGVKALRLKTTTETSGGPQSDTKMHGEATMYLNAATGKAIKVISKADGTAKGSTVTTEMTLEQTGPEDTKPSKKDSAPK